MKVKDCLCMDDVIFNDHNYKTFYCYTYFYDLFPFPFLSSHSLTHSLAIS